MLVLFFFFEGGGSHNGVYNVLGFLLIYGNCPMQKWQSFPRVAIIETVV